MVIRVCVTSLLLLITVYSVSGVQLEYQGCFDLSYAVCQRMHYRRQSSYLYMCTFSCTTKGNTQMGIEKSDNFYYCGDDIAEKSNRVDDTQCDVFCKEDNDEGGHNYTCGEYNVISVYKIPNTNVKTQTPVTYALPDTNSNFSLMLGQNDGVRWYTMYNMSIQYRIDFSNSVYSVDYHYAKGLAFGSTKDGKILRLSLHGKGSTGAAPSKVIKETTDGWEGFAVDWVQDRIYYADKTNSSRVKIFSMDLEGRQSNDSMSWPGESAVIKRIRIDPFNRILFWTANGVIETCDLSGNNYNNNLSAPGVTVRAISLDLEARRVFYIGMEGSSSSLYSMTYQGGESTLHYTTQKMRNVFSMDVFRDSVYWVNYHGQDLIYRGPKTHLTEAEDHIQLLAEINNTEVYDMKVVHPDLQKNHAPCPQGFEYQDDTQMCKDVTSSKETKAWTPSITMNVIFLFLLLLVIVILLWASLAFFGVGHWNTLKTKLARGSHQRDRGDVSVTSQYLIVTREDEELY